VVGGEGLISFADFHSLPISYAHNQARSLLPLVAGPSEVGDRLFVTDAERPYGYSVPQIKI
jgi:hypothetical protein